MSSLALCGSSMLAQAYDLIPLPYKAEVPVATVVPLADEAGLSMEYRLYQGTDIQGLQATGLSSGEVKLAVCMPAATRLPRSISSPLPMLWTGATPTMCAT